MTLSSEIDVVFFLTALVHVGCPLQKDLALLRMCRPTSKEHIVGVSSKVGQESAFIRENVF